MALFSFIDHGLCDFLRDENDEVIKIECESYDEAEDWLMKNHQNTDWTNEGTLYFKWEF